MSARIGHDEQLANARLFASAPNLLQNLQQILYFASVIEGVGEGGRMAVAAARRAVTDAQP